MNYNLNTPAGVQAYRKRQNQIMTNNDRGRMQVNVPPKPEMLLPTGFSMQSNGSIKTPLERGRRLLAKERQKAKKQTAESEEMLLPAGIKLED